MSFDYDSQCKIIPRTIPPMRYNSDCADQTTSWKDTCKLSYACYELEDMVKDNPAFNIQDSQLVNCIYNKYFDQYPNPQTVINPIRNSDLITKFKNECTGGGGTGGGGTTGMSTPLIIGIVAAVLIIGGGVAYYMYRRNKK